MLFRSEEIESQLGIKAGFTTPDLQFSINSTRCVGDCSLAPVIVINEDIYPKVAKNDIKGLIEKYKSEV